MMITFEVVFCVELQNVRAAPSMFTCKLQTNFQL